MIDPKKYQTRKTTPTGELTEAGFRFSEGVPTKYGFGCALSVVMIFCGVGWFAALAKGQGELAWLLFLALGGCFVLFIKDWRRSNRDEDRLWFWRNLIFCRDGRIIVTPRNKGPNPELVPFPFGWAEIATIEPRPIRTTGSQSTMNHGHIETPIWEVNFHLQDGRTVQCARDLVAEDYAHLVSTQLNMALEEIRSEATFGG